MSKIEKDKISSVYRDSGKVLDCAFCTFAEQQCYSK